MKIALLLPVLIAACVTFACCTSSTNPASRTQESARPSNRNVSATPRIPSRWSDLSINTSLMVPAGKHARKKMKKMVPTYITIHSTYNKARGANAKAHARGLYNGNHKSTHNSRGYLSWHFTIDDGALYQSIPCNETGEHADYEGKGNQKSIAIEMCENSDGSWSRTMDRTARFTAALMKEYNIPLNHVVPHQHWRQIRYSDGKDLGHKNCPHLLMDGGKPGPKWRAFMAKIEKYRRQLG